MTKELIKALVVLIIATPFIYMAFDVIMDLGKKSYVYYSKKARPVLVNVVNSLMN
ncbi:MAG: hypothetical protein AB7T22_14440 [Calditrichaceae bacterium]